LDDQRHIGGFPPEQSSHHLNLVNFFFSDGVDVVSALSAPGGTVLATLVAGDIPIAVEVTKSAVGIWREGIELLYENGRVGVAIPSPMAVDQCARGTGGERWGTKTDRDRERDGMVVPAPGGRVS